MHPFYSERFEHIEHSSQTFAILRRKKAFQIFHDRLICRSRELPVREITRIELGCNMKDDTRSAGGSCQEGSDGAIRVFTTIHTGQGQTCRGILINPLGFIKALERTMIGPRLKELLDIDGIQQKVRLDQKVRHALIRSTAEDWDPHASTGEFPALVNYLEGIGYNILRP